MSKTKQKIVQQSFFTAINVINLIALLVSIGILIASAMTLSDLEIGKFHVGKHFADFSFTWWILTTAAALLWGAIWAVLGLCFYKRKDDSFRYENAGLYVLSLLTIFACGCNFILIISGILGLMLSAYRQKHKIGTKTVADSVD